MKRGIIYGLAVLAIVLLSFLTYSYFNSKEAQFQPASPLGIVLNLSFDENSGNTAWDSAGDISGLVINSVWIRGVRGSGLDFDGNTSVVQLGRSDILNLTENLTIEAWVNPKTQTMSCSGGGIIANKE